MLAIDVTNTTGRVPFLAKTRGSRYLAHLINPNTDRTRCGLYGYEDMPNETDQVHTPDNCKRCDRVYNNR